MKNHFLNCQVIEDAKSTYKMLYVLHHSNVEFMQIVNAQFIDFKNGLTNPTATIVDKPTPPIDILNLAKDVATIVGCTVEVCNMWIWAYCTRENKAAHENLKSKGFRFSNTKKAWYFTNQILKKKRGTKTLPQIREKFGGEVIQKEFL